MVMESPSGDSRQGAAEPVKGYASGLRALVARNFLISEKHQSQHWRAFRLGADPQILLFEEKFLRRMHKLGIPMFATCIVRTLNEQTMEFVQGNTKHRAGESPHNYGCAVDFVHGIDGWHLAPESWELLGHIGKEIAAQNGIHIVWGGDMRDSSPAHWELEDWRERMATVSPAP